MKIKTVPAGLLQTNCYLVLDEASKILYVIDPGGDAGYIAAAAGEFEFETCYILLTHYHIDHVAAAGEIAKQLNAAAVFLRKEDHPYYYSPENHLLPYVPPRRGSADGNGCAACGMLFHASGTSRSYAGRGGLLLCRRESFVFRRYDF